MANLKLKELGLRGPVLVTEIHLRLLTLYREEYSLKMLQDLLPPIYIDRPSDHGPAR
jgi:hypothetical protein